MAENKLDSTYWTDRYQNQRDGWDIGKISTPLKEYFDQLENKNLEILIPGSGRGYEGLYLLEQGFTNVHFLDFSPEPLAFIKSQRSDLKDQFLHQDDVFKYQGQYDLIIEQTMFCALDPTLRQAYILKMHELLKVGGKLVGLFFNREFDGGPPFGGNRDEYRTYFESCFSEFSMEDCYNSIAPRMGSELFVKAIKTD